MRGDERALRELLGEVTAERSSAADRDRAHTQRRRGAATRPRDDPADDLGIDL